MGIYERDYARGHPPACNCAECTKGRLEPKPHPPTCECKECSLKRAVEWYEQHKAGDSQ